MTLVVSVCIACTPMARGGARRRHRTLPLVVRGVRPGNPPWLKTQLRSDTKGIVVSAANSPSALPSGRMRPYGGPPLTLAPCSLAGASGSSAGRIGRPNSVPAELISSPGQIPGRGRRPYSHDRVGRV